MFVIQDLYRLGAQYVTALLANELAERGCEVTVVVSAYQTFVQKKHPEWDSFALGSDVNLIILNKMKARHNIWELRKVFTVVRPDVIISMSSNYDQACAIARFLGAKLKKISYIVVEHSGGIGMDPDLSKRIVSKSPADKVLRAFMLREVDHVIAVSQGVKDALVSTGTYRSDKITVIYNPVISAGFFNKKIVQAKHPWLKLKSTPVIAVAGAHVRLKGYDVLLRAFSIVRAKETCRLIIFGEGPETDNLKTLARTLAISEFVSFPGHSNNLPSEIKECDCFVVSSHCESFSVVLVEALACGVPVVATDCPTGPTEILKNGLYGILVPVNDPDAMAVGILKVLKGKAIKPSSLSWEPYRVECVADQYLSTIYKNVAQHDSCVSNHNV